MTKIADRTQFLNSLDLDAMDGADCLNVTKDLIDFEKHQLWHTARAAIERAALLLNATVVMPTGETVPVEVFDQAITDMGNNIADMCTNMAEIERLIQTLINTSAQMAAQRDDMARRLMTQTTAEGQWQLQARSIARASKLTTYDGELLLWLLSNNDLDVLAQDGTTPEALAEFRQRVAELLALIADNPAQAVDSADAAAG